MTTGADVLMQIEEKGIKYVDLRFTDTKGKAQHVTVPTRVVDGGEDRSGGDCGGGSAGLWSGSMGDLIDPPTLGRVADVVVRLVAAAALGGALGIERERLGKRAGMRTHMLVALGAALFVLAAVESGAGGGELARVVQGIATGIGFVGAGTILKHPEEGEVRGLTVNSFTSVSLQPPLILVSLARSTHAVEHLSRVPFTISVLQASQVDLALHFAGRARDPVDVEWQTTGDDLAPTLTGALATFRCRPWQSYDGGDHILQLGQVIAADSHGDGEPLLFDRGRFAMVDTTGPKTTRGTEAA